MGSSYSSTLPSEKVILKRVLLATLGVWHEVQPEGTGQGFPSEGVGGGGGIRLADRPAIPCSNPSRMSRPNSSSAASNDSRPGLAASPRRTGTHRDRHQIRSTARLSGFAPNSLQHRFVGRRVRRNQPERAYAAASRAT